MMRRRWLLPLPLLLALPLAPAQAVETDEDGFTRPLERLTFNPGLDQREFERSTLLALDVPDPLEPWNRRVYHFNQRLDEWVLLPAVNAYQTVTPRFVRSGVSNFFNNLGDVGNLFNSLLQLKGKRSMEITARVLFNSTFGVLGLWDVASHMGLPRHKEDFGQTLGVYGVPPGPYLILPLFGPSNLRDVTGLASDFLVEGEIDFLGVSEASNYGHQEIWALRALDIRYQTPFRYGQLNSPFEYEKVRYVYTTARELQIAE